MASVQTRAGVPIRPPILLVQQESRPLKVEAGKGERLPFALRLADPLRVRIDHLRNRPGGTYATFSLIGLTPGDTSLSIRPDGATSTYIAAVAVRVIARLELPDPATDAGVLARLLLAEVPTPGDMEATTVAAETEAMTLMRVVLENRAARPSARWGSAGARSIADVARASGQFAGFGAYPTLGQGQSDNIADKLRIANTAGDARQPRLRAHVERAFAAASGDRPADPTRTGLYWWRTALRGGPGTGVVEYKTLLGNTFYREGP